VLLRLITLANLPFNSSYKTQQVNNALPQFLFCFVFTIATNMFTLVIFEIVGFMDRAARFTCWKIDLWMMLLMLVVVLPFYFIVVVVRSYARSRRMLTFGVAVAYGAFLIGFCWWCECSFDVLICVFSSVLILR
jgi:hypothetical protein